MFYNDVANSKPSSPRLATNVDVAATLGTTDVYVSLTASTSRGLSNHYIISMMASSASSVLNLEQNNTLPVSTFRWGQ